RDAFRALHAGDRQAQGTALEYLEIILPRGIRDSLWPFLEAGDRPVRSPRSKLAVLTELRLSTESVELSLSDLQRAEEATPGPGARGTPAQGPLDRGARAAPESDRG